MNINTLFVCAALTSIMTLTPFTPAFAQVSDTPPPPTDTESNTPPQDVPASKDRRRRFPLIGLEYGTYIPVSERTRARFGSAWTSFGFGLGKVDKVSRSGALVAELNFLSAGSKDKRAIIIPIGLEYQRALGGTSGRNIQPYFRTSLTVYGTFLKSQPDNIAYGLRFAYGGSATIGLTLGDRFLLEARHRAMTGVRGINLSGNEIRLGVRF